jgi:hypothetical protein
MSLDKDYEWIYEYVLQTIKSPEFRNPIKQFIDENCNSFIGIEENTFEQGGLFKEFVLLIENYLESSFKELGISDEMFCLAAKKGLENPNDKKYFEQLISFNNYNYFKNLMTKRNLQLEKMAYEEMKNANNQANQQQINQQDLEMLKKLEEDELKAAIQMSLSLEEEKKKLKAIEDLELKKAISKSKIVQNDISNAYKNNIPKEESSSDYRLLKNVDENSKSNEDKKIEQNKDIHKNPISVEKPQFSLINNNNDNNNDNNNKNNNNDNINNSINSSNYNLISQIENAPISPVQKVSMTQHEINEDEKKNIINTKIDLPPLAFKPNFNGPKNNSNINNNLNNLEAEKARKLKEYREMILHMRKEKRQKEEDDLFNNNDKPLTEEEKRRIALRKQLAAKLKNNNLKNLNSNNQEESNNNENK